ncbi:MAG: rod shape-determining protein MreC [Bdellovibrionales bacterium]|nr:rod shape-determining protein MreC [Bdellovibrionales bacterium]
MSKTLKTILGIFFFSYLIIQIISFGMQAKRPVGYFEKAVLFVVSPIQRIVNRTSESFRDVYRYYIALSHVSRENDILVKENSNLIGELSRLSEIQSENNRLREMLNMQKSAGASWSVVERIASGASPFQRSMRFKKPWNLEIKRGAPITHPLGIVGQVLDSHMASFDALLITDKASAIDVLCSRSRQRGILVGYNPSTLKFEYLEKSADIQLGDELVSTGLDDIYPKGIPVGKVVYVNREGDQLFMESLVKPFVDLSNLEEAMVLISN